MGFYFEILILSYLRFSWVSGTHKNVSRVYEKRYRNSNISRYYYNNVNKDNNTTDRSNNNVLIFRTYANETTQFLKSFGVGAPAGASATDAKSAATDETLVDHVTVWNPFDDPSPFCHLSEDHLFGAEFDKIRRGSQSSKFLKPLIYFSKCLCQLKWKLNSLKETSV